MKKLKYLILTILVSFCLIPLNVFAAGNIFVSKSNLNITKGNSSSFNITASNAAGRINISSSNSNVASVSSSSMFLDMQSGTVAVKANNVGSATITVYAADVTTYDDEDLTGKTYTINVTVTESSNNNTINNNNNSNNNNVNNNSGNTNNSNTGSTNKNKANDNKTINNLSTNNNVKELSVDGYDLVKVDNNNYTLIVRNDVTSINVKAALEDEKASITGIGAHELNVGENNIELIVTSESGAENKINIKVTRKDGYYLEDLDAILKDSKIKDIDIIITADSKLTKEVLNKIKNSKKTVKLNYYDDSKKLIYSWIVDGTKIKSTNELLTTISYTSKYVNEISKLSNYAAGLHISLSHNDKLPAGTKIKLYVGDKYVDNSKLNLYYYNTSTKKLELVQKGLNAIDGYIEFNAEKGSEYFLTMSNIILSKVKEGNNFNVLYIIPIVVFVIIAGILIFFLIKKNKKDEKSVANNDFGYNEGSIETMDIESNFDIVEENDENLDTEVEDEIDKIMNEN